MVQVALAHELAEHGLLVSKTKYIWLNAVLPRINARRFPMPGDAAAVSALFALDPVSGELTMRTFDENCEAADPAGLEQPDAPHLAVLLRIDLFLDRMIKRMEQVRAGGGEP